MKRLVSQGSASFLALGLASLVAAATPLPQHDSSSADLLLVASKSRPGSCGTHMYYSSKGGKCMDARDKTKSGWSAW